MLNGTQFVEALVRLGYPGASDLKASEFDWLFDSAPENLHFLRFFCGSLNQSNVLAPEEVRAFKALQASRKPILEMEMLEKVLKTCGPAEEASMGGGSGCAAAEASVEELEAELRELRTERQLKQQRLKKLQVLCMGRADTSARLDAQQEIVAGRVKDASAALGGENAATNAALHSLAEETEKLAGFYHAASPTVGKDGAAMLPPCPAGPPVLLSQLSLEPYLCQEERNTKALAAYTQRQFFQGICELVESSSAERFQLLELSRLGPNGGGQAEEDEREVERRRKEMAQLQWAQMVAQHQLLRAQAEEQGNRAVRDWLLERLRSKPEPLCSLQLRESALHLELSGLKVEVEALLGEPARALLRQTARLLNVPIVRGDLALQVARQDYYRSRQAEVRDQLLRQKARFELVQLAQQMELREGERALGSLGTLERRLEQANAAGASRLRALSEPELALGPRACPIICSRDVALSRLLQALELGVGVGREEPFRTYAALEGAAAELRRELLSAREALAGAGREQSVTGARLESECEALRQAAYSGLQQLLLRPQVCATATPAQEICPNAQELTVALQELKVKSDSLYKLLPELTGEIRTKQAQLERSATLRQERELYVYFHLDPKLLRKAVEEMEARAATAKGAAGCT